MGLRLPTAGNKGGMSEAEKAFMALPDAGDMGVDAPVPVDASQFANLPDAVEDFDPSKQAVSDDERLLIKNLIDADPNQQKEFLEAKGYEVREVEGRLQARTKRLTPFAPDAPPKFGLVEPENRLEFQDVTDVLSDLGEIGAQAAGAIAGAPGGVPGMMLGAAGAAGVFETAKQGLGQSLGVRSELDPSRVPEAMTAAAGEVLGPAAAGVLSKGADLVRRLGPKLRKQAPEVLRAARELGVEATPGQILDDKFIQRQENLLSEEGQLGGMGLRKTIRKNQTTLEEEAEALLEHAVEYRPVVAGAEAKQQLVQELQRKIEPAENIYRALDEEFGDVPVDKEFLRASIRDLKDDLEFSDAAMRMLNNWESKVDKIETIGQLKKFRTTALRKELPSQPNSNERYAVSVMYDAATEARKKSLMNFADNIGENVDPALANEIRQIPAIIKEADGYYAKLAQETKDSLLGLGAKSKAGPKEIVSKIEDLEDVDVAKKVFRTDKPQQLQTLKESSPEAFETLRKNQLAKIREKSLEGDEVNVSRFLRQLDPKSMPDETKKLLFGEDAELKINAMRSFLRSRPAIVNPSGTSKAQNMRHLLNVFAHFSSLGRSALVSAKASPVKMTALMNRAAKVLESPLGRAAIGQGAEEKNKSKRKEERK